MDTNNESPQGAFAPAAGYVPEVWKVEKDTIYAAIYIIEDSIPDIEELLAIHDRDLGRTTRKNKNWAETLENQIRIARETLAKLKACGPVHNDKLRDARPATETTNKTESTNNG